MKVIKTAIEGLVIIEPKMFGDGSGYSSKAYRKEKVRKSTSFKTTNT